MINVPLNGRRPLIRGYPATITKTREIFKIQVALNVEDKILVYNKDRSHGNEFTGRKAHYIIQHYGLSKWGKRKTYVYGKWLENTGTIQLESAGEVPEAIHPDW